MKNIKYIICLTHGALIIYDDNTEEIVEESAGEIYNRYCYVDQ
jgi:hypothetical protein